jgi:hypothetical protein
MSQLKQAARNIPYITYFKQSAQFVKSRGAKI